MVPVFNSHYFIRNRLRDSQIPGAKLGPRTPSLKLLFSVFELKIAKIQTAMHSCIGLRSKHRINMYKHSVASGVQSVHVLSWKNLILWECQLGSFRMEVKHFYKYLQRQISTEFFLLILN